MFDEYIKLAVKKQQLSSQNQLAKLLNISTAAIAQMNTGQILPSEETLLKVAALAGIPEEKALIDLNLWRSKDSPDRLRAWKKVSKIIQLTLAISLILCILTPENSIPANTSNVYYVNLILLFYMLYQYFKDFNKILIKPVLL